LAAAPGAGVIRGVGLNTVRSVIPACPKVRESAQPVRPSRRPFEHPERLADQLPDALVDLIARALERLQRRLDVRERRPEQPGALDDLV